MTEQSQDEQDEENPFAGVVWVPRFRALQAGIAVAAVMLLAGVPAAFYLHSTAVTIASVVAAWVAIEVGRRRARGASLALEGKRIEASREGLRVGGELVAPRATVTEASLSRDDQGFWFVYVHRRFHGFITIGVPGRQDGIALIDALQLGPRVQTARFLLTDGPILLRGLLAMVVIMGGLLARALLHPPPLLHLAMLALSTAVAFALVWTRVVRVHVGADGLVVRSWRGARLIPHAEVERVAREGTDIVVRLASGEALRWPMALRESDRAQAEGMADAIVARIGDARAVFAEGGGEPGALALLSPRGRSASEWLAALRRAGVEATAGFREGALTRERLWDLVDSPKTPALERVGAAIALRVAEDGVDARARIAAIADQCADAELARRLRQAAEGEAAEALAEELLEEEALLRKRA